MNILIKLINDVKATLALIKAKTDTITADLFTATHASRIDANISSRQASWGATSTHASRIDASISSRALETTAQAIKAKTDLIASGGATNDGVWTAPGRTLSHITPSSTVRLSVATERIGNPLLYKFLFKSAGSFNLSFDAEGTTGGNTTININVKNRGILVSSGSVVVISYATKTLNSIPAINGVVEIEFSATSNFKVKNLKVMYAYDELITPIQL